MWLHRLATIDLLLLNCITEKGFYRLMILVTISIPSYRAVTLHLRGLTIFPNCLTIGGCENLKIELCRSIFNRDLPMKLPFCRTSHFKNSNISFLAYNKILISSVFYFKEFLNNCILDTILMYLHLYRFNLPNIFTLCIMNMF